MVNTKDYFEAFSKEMPRRIKAVQELVKKKRLIDEEVTGAEGWSEEARERLKGILGEDHMLKHAEERHQTSLRRACWKILKSIEWFRKFASEHDLDESINNIETKKFRTRVRKITESIEAWLNELEKYIEDLDDAFEEEYSYIEKDKREDYVAVVGREKELLNDDNLKSILENLRDAVRRGEKVVSNAELRSPKMILAFGGLGVIASICYAFFPAVTTRTIGFGGSEWFVSDSLIDKVEDLAETEAWQELVDVAVDLKEQSADV